MACAMGNAVTAGVGAQGWPVSPQMWQMLPRSQPLSWLRRWFQSLIFLLMASKGVSYVLSGLSSDCLSGWGFSNTFAEAAAPIKPMSL